MAFAPTNKNPGDLIKSSDWNDALNEVVRLDGAKLNLTGGNLTGPLTVQGAMGLGTKTPDRALTLSGAAGTYLNVKGNNGAFEVLLGADSAGGIVSTMTNHDLLLRAGANITRLIIKADGKVGIGINTPTNLLDVADRISVRQGPSGSAGIWLNQTAAFNRGFLGMVDDNWVGMWGSGFGWGLQMNATSGIVYLPASLGIGTSAPAFKLDVADRMRVRQGIHGSAGIWFYQSVPNTDRAFVGMINDNSVGLWGSTGAGWGLAMDTTNASVVLRSTLTVNSGAGQQIMLGIPSGPYAGDGIRGNPNLWLDAAAANGKVIIKQGFTSQGMDIAERFQSDGAIEPGQVLVFDELANAVTLCDREADNRVVGIASTAPACVLGLDEREVPVALCGRVPCLVDADIAPITAGDLLTTSPTKGHAQKVLEPGKAVGAILGKAMGSLNSGRAKITVMVVMQ